MDVVCLRGDRDRAEEEPPGAPSLLSSPGKPPGAPTPLSSDRFPKEAELRRRWLAAAQRDEGSLRTNSRLCSRHFEPACFSPGEEAGAGGRPALAADAVPTVMLAPLQEDEVTASPGGGSSCAGGDGKL